MAHYAGITPARAGNSGRIPLLMTMLKDHPRVCGEQHVGLSRRLGRKGSPPRVRGTGEPGTDAEVVNRITPACAGNSLIGAGQAGQNGDHPRVCGEQGPIGSRGGSTTGSPPRVRGTACAGPGLALVWTITPACAGNRDPPFWLLVGSGDHPRVCGEQDAEGHGPGAGVGSPPRVRGTANEVTTSTATTRITPACAGNSVSMTNPQII